MNRTIYQYENKSRPVQEPSTGAKSRQDFPLLTLQNCVFCTLNILFG